LRTSVGKGMAPESESQAHLSWDAGGANGRMRRRADIDGDTQGHSCRLSTVSGRRRHLKHPKNEKQREW
jgi:hypothetical protein